ncbi:hypothetical protein Ddc_18237 [Ditylenchus destructor]|nr:hypothetical protein Ddc_18237 [Ditylenchus destructor]
MEMKNGPQVELFLFYLLIFVSSFYIVLLILYFPFIVPIVIGLGVAVYIKATKSQRDVTQARAPKDSETELHGGAVTENQESGASKSKSNGLAPVNIQDAPTINGIPETATVITLEAID